MTLTPTSTPAALIEAAYAAARWLANAHVDLAEARAERGPLDAKDEEECAAAVAAAERAGLLAVGAVRAGRWPDAFLHANEAWSCEACFSAWCDAPTWGPLLQAIKEGERWVDNSVGVGYARYQWHQILQDFARVGQKPQPTWA